ncbi:Scramblase-domain-containing protein [Aspergillus cavernicola]|uniref:Scramblase-domain-containing protein n=1 Tax=Aspergillus cavernicola TaxID=176166 RepID=A0ABR4IDS8_9EURO
MWSTRIRIPPLRWLQAPRSYASSFTRGRATPHNSQNSMRRPPPIRREPTPSDPETGNTGPPVPNYEPSQNTLLSPVHIPEDPRGVLKESHPAAGILTNSGLVIQRQLELMNVMIGFEQANKYVIMDAAGNHIGYMAEQEKGMGNMMARQWFRTHRSFVTHVFDKHENEVLRFHRPFSWINSRIQVYDPLDVTKNSYSSSTTLQPNTPGSLVQATDSSHTRISSLGFDQMRVIGEAQAQWAPLRRKYNLFTYHDSPNSATEMGTQRLPLAQTGLSNAQQTQLTHTPEGESSFGEFNQFAYVNEPFLSWDFSLRSADNRLIGSVNRDFVGFAREIFTDTGVYALRMDSAALNPAKVPDQGTAITGMTLDQRAVMLATAVSIDFAYFSRHSGAGAGAGGMGFFPMWIPGLGGDAAAGGAAAGEAGAVGEAAAGTLGRGAAGGMADGAAAGAAGAGAIAGYDAMSRGMTGESQPQGGSPEGQTNQYGDVWAPEQKEEQSFDDPWSGDDSEDGGGGGDDYDFF